LRGVIAGFGFPGKEIIYDRRMHNCGKSKIGLNGLIKLRFISIAHVKFIFKACIIIFFVAFIFSIVGVFNFSVSKITSVPGYLPPGFTTLAILLLMSIAIN
jgi:hypothetical protein